MSFFAELKRRNVFRVGIAYSITGWLIAQIAGLAAASFFAPDWVMKMIITILLLGFPVAMVMAWAYDLTPEGLRRDSKDEAAQAASTSKLDRTIIIALVAALAYFAYDKFVLDPGRDAAMLESVGVQTTEAEVAAEQSADSAEAQVQSIAVLPFVNMSDDAGNEYFSEGLSEELLNLLVKIPELQVAARTSSFSYKGKDTQIAQIGEELHVAHVLEGSVRKSGNQVRITTQLIKADNGFHLWSETFDRTLDDIFVVQDEIAAAVVQALRVTMLGEKPEQRTTDPEVYALYLQGKYFTNLGDRENLEKAVSALKQALSIDPKYAPAWVALQISYYYQTIYGVRTQSEGSALAMEAAKNALAADPNYASAWASLGYLKRTYEWDWAGAQEAIDKALKLEPNNSQVWGAAASLANSLGQQRRATNFFEKSISVDPLSLPTLRALGSIYLRSGRFDEAIDLFTQLLAINPDHPTAHRDLGRTYWVMGDYDRAMQEIDQGPQSDANSFYKAGMLFAQGQDADAWIMVEELLKTAALNQPISMAYLYAAAGDKDSAFAWLETAFQQRDSSLSYILTSGGIGPLKSDPRFPLFLEKMGLREYWEAMPPEFGGPPK